jgi:mannose-1-phosphate guanylyltransferase
VTVRWPAMVLTAGLGSRLRPLSYVRAKPAVPVAGEALIRRIIRWLASHGVRALVLNLHYRGETIRSEVGDGSDLGVSVRYSPEEEILGSAGGPRRALPLLGVDRFLLVNGDTLTDLDLAALARAHDTTGAKVTMALVRNPDPGKYGGVVLGREGSVVAFARAGSSASDTHLFIGVQAVEASVFAGLPPDVPAETVAQVYPALIAAHPGSIRGFVCEASFFDIGTPADYLATALALARREGRDELPMGRGCRVDPTARLLRTALWNDVRVDAGAVLVDCVVTDGVHVVAGTSFRQCSLTPMGSWQPAAGTLVAGDVLVTPFTTGTERRPEVKGLAE